MSHPNSAAEEKRENTTQQRVSPPSSPVTRQSSQSPKMKFSLAGKHVLDTDKPVAASAVSKFAVPVGGDGLNFSASVTDFSFSNGPSLNGLLLSLQKPGSFTFNFDLPKKDFSVGENRTAVEGTLVFDPENKVSASHTLGQGRNGRLKYSYVHGGVTTVEPSYDLGKNAWDFAVARKVSENDVVRASYQTGNKNLGLEWSRNSKVNGSFK
ncbi:Outer envelope pore protein 24, chloroplastic-like protein, partial [Drosera capensis]